MDIQTVTASQLRKMGIDPEHPFSTTPRIKDKPFCFRYKETLISRLNGGQVSIGIGYFSKGQILARKIAGKRLYEELKKFTG